MATDYLGLSQITELQSSKYLTANSQVGEIDSAIAEVATVLISTTTPVTIASAVSTRAARFVLTDDASPPVAGFTVQFPAAKRGFVHIKNATSFTATIEISGQSSPPTLAAGESRIYFITATDVLEAGGGSTASEPFEMVIAVGDETTTITTGTAKVTFRMPRAVTLTDVRASLVTVSSSGVVTVDINEAGTTILSTKLTIDASEKTSVTAATPAVISDTSLADDAEMTIDIDGAGTGAAGLKVTLRGTHT